MALTAAEEALVRELIAQNPELLSLAGNEATIISKLGATKKNLSQLAAALSLNDTDLAFVRQGSSDKSVALSVLKAYAQSGIDLSLYLPKSGGTMTGLLKFAAGSNIASSATVNLSTATGNTVHITGTAGINAWTMTDGQFMQVIFDGVLTLTHHATNNNLQGSANITTAAGDRAFLYYDGTTIYVFQYIRADGTPIVNQSKLTGEYKSAQQTITAGGGLTLAHGLASIPKLCQLQLVCTTADAGYAVNDVLFRQAGGAGFGGGASIEVWPDATNINVRIGSGSSFSVVHKTTGAQTAITLANWRLIVEAWS